MKPLLRPTMYSHSLLALLLVHLLVGCASPSQSSNGAPSDETAKLLLQCHHFYSTAVDDARRTKPEYFVPGHPFLKTVNAAQAMRITAEVLVGDTVAETLYRENLPEWSMMYRFAALSSSSWQALTNHMTIECKQALNDADKKAGQKIQERLLQRGISF